MPPRKKAAPASGLDGKAAPQSILKKRAAEYRKMLDDKLAQIHDEYLARANAVKQRTKDKIRESKKRISTHRTRERRQMSARLLKLLDAREAKFLEIAGRLGEMKRDYDTFASCLSSVYETLGVKAGNIPGISPGLDNKSSSQTRVSRRA